CLSGGEDRPIRLVRHALELSADRLTESAEGLACYLYGRLYSHRELPEIGALRQQTAPKGWQPMHEPTHHQAGGHLLRTLRGHEEQVLGALELRDGRLLSWSEDKTLRLWVANGTLIDVIHTDVSVGSWRAWFAQHNALEEDFEQFLRTRHSDGFAPAPERG
ncbi:MAG: hypothetical protein CUN51_08580, partial [Candidatus Thermofonsia Clade 1 bacterium]